ncbi:MAG: hypothetical protein HETSPECPRED_001983 [Heterodermia speciosa]|uniref:G-patch domain-containing protein n=1 Tax=Heterodermia speciosa TaxID=116794 RepID=A0A8H3EYY9_9LECA|nr:MAG: hypothetical protein HETSPECPRED_001983 [Heterodermia speciosa]
MEPEEESTIPLQDQRVFGAGLKRKRINFVPAATSSSPPPRPPPTTNAGQRYLSIVSGNTKNTVKDQADARTTPDPTPEALTVDDTHLCQICNLPIAGDARPHESSLVHQVCLAHSHPPSHLDRNRAGLRYLSSYGWDPDSRLGLGAKGEGVRVPIKAMVKNDTVGLGVERAVRKRQVVAAKAERLDAKGVRSKELEERKRGERLQQMFYGADDVEKYLGGGG